MACQDQVDGLRMILMSYYSIIKQLLTILQCAFIGFVKGVAANFIIYTTYSIINEFMQRNFDEQVRRIYWISFVRRVKKLREVSDISILGCIQVIFLSCGTWIYLKFAVLMLLVLCKISSLDIPPPKAHTHTLPQQHHPYWFVIIYRSSTDLHTGGKVNRTLLPHFSPVDMPNLDSPWILHPSLSLCTCLLSQAIWLLGL